MKMSLDNLLEQLRGDETYNGILRLLKTDAEREIVKAQTENFVSSAYENLFVRVQEELAKDPDSLKKIYQELEQRLVKDKKS